MGLTADDMKPCRACGKPCDGDVCDQRCADALGHDCKRCGEPCDCDCGGSNACQCSHCDVIGI